MPRWDQCRCLACIVGLLLLAAGCSPLTFVVEVAPSSRQLQPTKVMEDGRWWGSHQVAIVDVSGLLINASRPTLLEEGENPTSLLYERLKTARENPRIKAVILRINSPGGTVTASDVMYREIQRFKAETGKPVVALLMDVGASGGYYVACAADEIIAYPTTVTGSVGVILQTLSVKPALANWGVRTEAFTSGPNKAATSPFNELTDENREVLQQLVDDFYERFVAMVRQRRPEIDPAQFDKVTDGRIVSGEQAAQLGLVDRVGDLHDAFERAKARAKIKAADLVIYDRPLRYVGSPYARAQTPPGGTQVNVAQFNFDDLGRLDSGFYYLWVPDLP